MDLISTSALSIFVLGQVVVFLYGYARLHTRVAILEASHTQMTDDLKEIRSDVKELLRLVAS
jgi:hypothetical protein